MKYIVTISLQLCFFLFVLAGPPLGVVQAKNSCLCQDPPGGQITCEENQYAFCKVIEGKVYGDCKTPPKSSSKGVELDAWVLSEVLGTAVQPRDVRREAKLQEILWAKHYQDPRTGEITTFSPPEIR